MNKSRTYLYKTVFHRKGDFIQEYVRPPENGFLPKQLVLYLRWNSRIRNNDNFKFLQIWWIHQDVVNIRTRTAWKSSLYPRYTLPDDYRSRITSALKRSRSAQVLGICWIVFILNLLSFIENVDDVASFLHSKLNNEHFILRVKVFSYMIQ